MVTFDVNYALDSNIVFGGYKYSKSSPSTTKAIVGLYYNVDPYNRLLWINMYTYSTTTLSQTESLVFAQGSSSLGVSFRTSSPSGYLVGLLSPTDGSLLYATHLTDAALPSLSSYPSKTMLALDSSGQLLVAYSQTNVANGQPDLIIARFSSDFSTLTWKLTAACSSS